MRINHLDLQTGDVFATRDFFVRFFGFELVTSPASPAIAILRSDGFTLVLQRAETAPAYPHGFHLGFYLETKEAVTAKHEELQAAGFGPSALIENNRGFMLYVNAPGPVLVEVNCPAAMRGARQGG